MTNEELEVVIKNAHTLADLAEDLHTLVAGIAGEYLEVITLKGTLREAKLAGICRSQAAVDEVFKLIDVAEVVLQESVGVNDMEISMANIIVTNKEYKHR